MKGRIFSNKKRNQTSLSNEGLPSQKWLYGDRVIWKRNNILEYGTIRWLGHILSISESLIAGVEFDNPIGYGDGKIGLKRYFYGKNNHIWFLPIELLNKTEDQYSNSGSALKQLNCSVENSKQSNSRYLKFKTGSKDTCKNQKNKSVSVKHQISPKFGQWWSEDETEENYNKLQNKSYSVESCPEMFSVKCKISSSSESDSDSKNGLQMLISCFIPKSNKYHKRKKLKNRNLKFNEILIKYKSSEDVKEMMEKRKNPPPLPPPPSPLLLSKTQIKLENCNHLSKSDDTLDKKESHHKNYKSNDFNISKSADKLNVSISPKLQNKTSTLPSRYRKRRAPLPPVNNCNFNKENCNKNLEHDLTNNKLLLEENTVELLGESYKNKLEKLETCSQQQNNSLKLDTISVSPPVLPVKKIAHDTKTLFGYSLKDREENSLNNKINQDESSCDNSKYEFINFSANNPDFSNGNKTVNSSLSRKIFYQSSSLPRKKTKLKNKTEIESYSKVSLDKFRYNHEKETDFQEINKPLYFTDLLEKHTHTNIDSDTKNTNDLIKFLPQEDCFKESGIQYNNDSYLKQTMCNSNQNRTLVNNSDGVLPFVVTSENYVTFSVPQSQTVTHANTNVNSLNTKHSFIHKKYINKYELFKEEQRIDKNKENNKLEINIKENNSLIDNCLKKEQNTAIMEQLKLTSFEKEKKNDQYLHDIILNDSTVNQNTNKEKINLQYNYKNKYLLKPNKPLFILDETQEFDINNFNKNSSESKVIQNSHSIKECSEKKLNSVYVQTESLFGELGESNQNSNSEVCSSANFYNLTQESRTPQTSTTLAVTLPELRPNRIYQHDSLHSSNQNISMSERIQLTNLFKQLEIAIAAGQHERAANLAKKLALHKDSFSVNQFSIEENIRRKPIIVNLYIEDKFLHQGPFPLKIQPSMTLGMLKSKLEKEYSIPKEFQRWILNKQLVTDDDVTLYNYGVTEEGCSLFLYLMYPISESKEHNSLNNNSLLNKEQFHQKSSFEKLQSPLLNFENIPDIPEEKEDIDICATCGIVENCHSCQESVSATQFENSCNKSFEINSNENYETLNINKEYDNLRKEAEKNYQFLIQLDNQDLIPNAESFECSVCFNEVKINEGVVLRDCLHQFCKQCLANAIEFTEDAIIKCLFRNDQYSCESILQEREIKALVTPETFERYLRRGLVTAEGSTENSFHCKSPDCPGWCVYEDTINTFSCPVCFHVNCLSCQAIHEGLNCKQYQDELAYRSERDREAKETKEYLENMVKEGKAMFCPKCNVIVMKRWGCDWLKCSVCQTEICWITKQPRWGPEGHGDTSGGCKCGLNGKRCHPQCNYCH